MRIKILKCSNDLYWYNNFIGEVFHVVKVTPALYWCRERNEYKAINFIRKEDSEVIEDVKES